MRDSIIQHNEKRSQNKGKKQKECRWRMVLAMANLQEVQVTRRHNKQKQLPGITDLTLFKVHQVTKTEISFLILLDWTT